MTIRPTLAEARALAEGHTVVPVAMELYADIRTSIEILRSIRQKHRQFYILESVENSDSMGRYSFIGYEPSMTIRGRDGHISIRNGTWSKEVDGDPLQELKAILARYRSPRIPELPPFTGGLVGYFSYDFIKYSEKTLRLDGENPHGFDDFHLMLFDQVIAVDHFQQKLYLIVNASTENLDQSYIEAVTRLKDMEGLILSPVPEDDAVSGPTGDFSPLFTREEYCQMVDRGRAHIREGDIFQVVLSNRFTAGYQGSLLQAYRKLRTTNRSPYMFYLGMDGIEIAGASPETLISLKDGLLTTYPLAGTCPRGKTREEDEALTEALLHNEKELSEHNMLVDLGRNDLGRVSRFGTVRVEEYQLVKKFSHVCHIASKVTGRMREDLDAVDAMAATLPAGTLSGAPKRRACEIIDAQEGQKRGVYGGAIGYMDFAGNMDLCIGIRMAVLKDGKVHVQAGAGIVADSDPAQEYTECMNKAGAVMEALQPERGV